MIVCSCNRLSEADVRGCCLANVPQYLGQVYRCLGCSPRCGRCARTINAIMQEALASSEGCACPDNCHCPAGKMEGAT